MLFAGKMGFEEFGHVSVRGFCLCPRIECNGCSCVPCVPPDLGGTHL
jgi:hypothetical protein